MSSYQKIKGDMGEKAVKDFLQNKRYSILAEKYCINGGEIDLIAVKDNTIRFIEVKTRKPSELYSGLEAVDKRKQLLIIRAALKFCSDHVVDLQPCFDVALVCMDKGCIYDINYLESAFDLSNCDSIF